MKTTDSVEEAASNLWFMKRLESPAIQHLLGLLLLAVVACGLYLPYLGSPLVFDDVNIFNASLLTTAAIAPWEVGIRGLPYFTLGWMETQIGSMEAQRLLSLALHVVVAWQLFRFLESALTATQDRSIAEPDAGRLHARCVALLVALLFACHPAAVYGAGYLVQRTIVFATLFSLICLRCMLAALERNDKGLAASAAAWVSLAILSKEHAVLVPGATLMLFILVRKPWRDTWRLGVVFLVLSTPAILFALHTSFYSAVNRYEPAIKEIESELYALPALSGGYEKWLLSASTQVELYFRYWQQWLLPDSRHMSVDLRVDFLRPWTHTNAWLELAGFALLPLAAMLASLVSGKARLPAFALVFTAILFAVELVSVRFQEPYVLYRSYLWSIGYCTLFAALAYRLPKKWGLGMLLLAVPLLLFQAKGRLDSFSSRLALWEDAAAKLPKLEIGGSSRILFNRGGARFRAGNIEGALSDINEAIRLNPANGNYRISKGVAMLRLRRPSEAFDELQKAEALLPNDGRLLFFEFRALQALGRTQEADSRLAAAFRFGSVDAKFELARRQSLNGDVTIKLN